MPNVVKLFTELYEADVANANAVDFNQLNQHEMNDIFVPVTNSRYNVCHFGIDAAARAIAASYPDIPAISAAELHAAANTVPAPESITMSPEATASIQAASHAVESVFQESSEADSFMATGPLAHAAYQASTDDSANAQRVQRAWNNYGQAGPHNVIDPSEIPTTSTENLTEAEQHQYLTVIADTSEPVPGGSDTAAVEQAAAVEQKRAAVARYWASQPQRPQLVSSNRQSQAVPPYIARDDERMAA